MATFKQPQSKTIYQKTKGRKKKRKKKKKKRERNFGQVFLNQLSPALTGDGGGKERNGSSVPSGNFTRPAEGSLQFASLVYKEP